MVRNIPNQRDGSRWGNLQITVIYSQIGKVCIVIMNKHSPVIHPRFGIP